MDPRLSELRQAAEAFGVTLAAETAEKLVRLADLVLAANARIRLTSITAWDEVLAKHLLDSLAPLALGAGPRPGQQTADLGSGGGFPGLVLAAVLPDLPFTLIESTNKKADFLAETAAALTLANVRVWPRRAEEAGLDEGREAFDLILARAVAGLPVLVELAHPLLKSGRRQLLAWKGPESGGEMEAAAGALARLGGEIRETKNYALPGGWASECWSRWARPARRRRVSRAGRGWPRNGRWVDPIPDPSADHGETAPAKRPQG